MASNEDEQGFNSDGTQHESAGPLLSCDEEEEESQQRAAQNVKRSRLFIDNKGPLHFHFRDLKTRERDAAAAKHLQKTLEELIRDNGGKVVKRLHESNRDVTVLIPDEKDKQACKMALLLGEGKSFKHEILVEGTSFVRSCIRSGMVAHNTPKPQGMGGQTNRVRVPFNDDDDESLIWWISRKIPTNEQGGRSGGSIFQELCNMSQASLDEFEWVNRHTWQSWRNRYVKNKSQFDEKIDRCAEKYPPNKYGVYYRDRRLSKRNLRDMDVEDDGDYAPNQEAVRNVRRPRKQRRTWGNSSDDGPPTEVRPGANDKGKGKANAEVIVIPSDEEDQLDQDEEIQFGNGNDPFALHAGPSGTRHTTPPEPTQATLVGPNPEPKLSQHPNRRRTLPVFGARRPTQRHRSSEPRAPRRPPSQANQQDNESQHQSEEDGFDAHVAATLTPTPPPLSVPPSASAAVPVPPTPQAGPLPKQDRRKRRAALAHANGRGDAPYRNTRSRSRSVEPQPQNNVRNTGRSGQLGTVAEDEREGEESQQREQPSAGNPVSGAGTETYEDDNDVAQLLFEGISAGSDGVRVSHEEDGEGQEVEGEEVEEVEDVLQSQDPEPFELEGSDAESVPKEDSDLDEKPQETAPGAVESAESFELNSLFDGELASDDRETDYMLQSQLLAPPPPSSSQSRSRASSILLDFNDGDPDEIFQMYQDSVYQGTSRQSRLARNRRTTLPQRPIALANPGPRAHSVPDLKSSPQSGDWTTNLSQARERRPRPGIVNQSYERESSVSSVVSIPRSGTRASQAKRDWEAKEKESPYRPLHGTRAAKVRQSLEGDDGMAIS